jgi:two-component system, OmpR family, KDP operon response regulator KdpE
VSAGRRTRVLIVDDEPQLIRTLSLLLRGAGYSVSEAGTVADGIRQASETVPDAIVLDLGLPDGDGLAVCAEVRRWSKLPVLVLSAVGDEREKVRVLDAGADDYVTKPFGAEELLARLRAVLRRAADSGSSPIIKVGDLSIDLAERRVSLRREQVHLTPIEFGLLSMLAREPGRLVTHRLLLREVWGPAYTQETHYLRVHFAHIRAKLEDDPARPVYVLTEPGVGYRLGTPAP